MDDLKSFVREIPDFPKPGILFYDITTLLQNAHALRMTVDRFVWLFADKHVDKVVGMESRGFMFGPIVVPALIARVPIGFAIAAPAQYSPGMTCPSRCTTRPSASVRSPPLVATMQRSRGIATNGGRAIGSSGVRPPDLNRCEIVSPRPKSSSEPVSQNRL